MLEILVGRDGQQHHDEQHLTEAELAASPTLATGGEQLVMLPCLNQLGKVIETAEQGNGRIRQRGPSVCVLQVDTESGHA